MVRNGTGGESYDKSTIKGANAFISLKASNMKHVGEISKLLATEGACYQQCIKKFVQVYQFHNGLVSEFTFNRLPYGIWLTQEGEVITKNDTSYVCAYNIEWARKYFGI